MLQFHHRVGAKAGASWEALEGPGLMSGDCNPSLCTVCALKLPSVAEEPINH